MNNKKAAMELSMGTIIILVLAMTMLILGLILVRSIFDKPQFIITKDGVEFENIEFEEKTGDFGTYNLSQIIDLKTFDGVYEGYYKNCVNETNYTRCEHWTIINISKQNLSLDFLETNTRCIECVGTQEDEVTGETLEPLCCDRFQRTCLKVSECKKYKIGDYEIEVI